MDELGAPQPVFNIFDIGEDSKDDQVRGITRQQEIMNEMKDIYNGMNSDECHLDISDSKSNWVDDDWLDDIYLLFISDVINTISENDYTILRNYINALKEIAANVCVYPCIKNLLELMSEKLEIIHQKFIAH